MGYRAIVPTDEKCPQCGAALEAYNEKGYVYTECSNPECDFHGNG